MLVFTGVVCLAHTTRLLIQRHMYILFLYITLQPLKSNLGSIISLLPTNTAF